MPTSTSPVLMPMRMRSSSALDLGRVARQRVLHPQRGAHGPLGVVLVGDRRAEQGDDGVAEQLVDAAAEQLDVGHEALEARLHQALHPLGVEVLGERRVADEVGEQDGDDAPLLERDVAPQHPGAARRTEPGPRWHRMVARGARDHRHASNLGVGCHTERWRLATRSTGGWTMIIPGSDAPVTRRR